MSALPTTVICSADGATAEVHHHGAHVTSWCPAPGDEERLYLSACSEMREGAAIRGGIPVIFPQFAAEGPLPRHGFARTSTWSPGTTGEGFALFHLSDSLATQPLWPAHFRATLDVRVGGSALEVTLSVENTGSEPFAFTAALHTYLRVEDVTAVKLLGLHGTQYRVSGGGATLVTDDTEAIQVTGEIDRVYVNAPRRVTLQEPTRTLHIDTVGFPDVVVWNPGPARAASLKDMAIGDERHMLCVEAGVVQEPVTLAAGLQWTGTQMLTA